MKELRSEVSSLVDIELERANDIFSLFNSDHEGVSVVREEMKEAKADMDSLEYMVDILEADVFCNSSDESKEDHRKAAEREAIELACEAIQTAAMLRKFKMSKEPLVIDPAEDPFSQEQADALADKYFEEDNHEKEFKHFMWVLFQNMIEKHKEEQDA